MTRFTFTFVVLVSLLFTAESGGREAPNLDKTLAAQKRLISEQPHHAEGHNDLGNLLVLAGRFEEAESAYGRALELDPANTSAGFNLGLLLQQDGRPKEALQAFNAVIETDPGHAWATYQAGAVLHERGKRKDALEHYARAFALDSSLTFAKTNPHFIDNSLATEALLMSDKYADSASTRMPRLYGEPERIVDLMLEVEEAEALEKSADREAGGEGESGQKRRRRPRPLEQAEEAGEPVQHQGLQSYGEDDEDDEDNGDRTRRSQSVQGIGGTVVGSSTTGRVEEKGRGNVRQGGTPGRGATVDRNRARGGGSRGTGNVQRPSPNRSRYRPATTSTGRLELELLPESEEVERVTR